MRNWLTEFTNRCIDCADFLALRQGDTHWTYAQLAQAVAQCQQQLAHGLAGLPPGQRIGLCMWNQWQWPVTLIAAWQLGHVVVPLNPGLTPAELAYIAPHAGLCCLVMAEEEDTPAATTLHNTQEHQIPIARWHGQTLQMPPGIKPNPIATPPNLALLIYTSGTTGTPKGVMLTHTNLWANVQGNLAVLGTTGPETMASLSPFFHVFGLINVLMSCLATGSCLRLLRRFNPRKVWQTLMQDQLTLLTGTPAMYLQVLQHAPQGLNPSNWPRLKVCHSGAAPLPVPLLTRLEATMGVPVQEGYGLSEATSIVTSNPLGYGRKQGCIGKAIPGVTAMVMLSNGLPAQPHTQGLLWVTGPTVMPGYWQQPAPNLITAANGTVWLNTGDVMTVDEDGFFQFVGRQDDQINRGGLKCYPIEIETVLLAHPWVTDVAVSLVQNQLTAYVVLAPHANPADATGVLRDHAYQQLTGYKVPKQWLWVASLPKGPTGKLLRRALLHK
jgi:long-chain acyl-CoA synthetase